MNNRLQMGIVVIENVTADAVDKRRVHDVEALGTAKQVCLRRPGKRRERRHRAIHGFVMRTTDSDSDPIHQCPHALLTDLSGQVLITSLDNKLSEDTRDFRRVCGVTVGGRRHGGRTGCVWRLSEYRLAGGRRCQGAHSTCFQKMTPVDRRHENCLLQVRYSIAWTVVFTFKACWMLDELAQGHVMS